MTSDDDNRVERLAQMAGEAVEIVSASGRLRADRAAGVISEAEYRAALRDLEREKARGDPPGADDDRDAEAKAP